MVNGVQIHIYLPLDNNHILRKEALTSSNRVIKDRQDNEEDVNDGQTWQKQIERVSHLWAGQNNDGDNVAKYAQDANDCLKTNTTIKL